MTNQNQNQTHEFTLTINLNHLRAVATAMCTPKQDQMRTYLHGVHVTTLHPAHPDSEQPPYRGYALEATDGHRLMRAVNRDAGAYVREGGEGYEPRFSFLLPHDAVQTLIKSPLLKKIDFTTVRVSFAGSSDPSASQVTLHLPGGTHSVFSLPNTTFPDTSRVTPERVPSSETAAQYNDEYLADMGKAAVALAPHRVRRDAKRAYHVHQDGKNVAVVTFDADENVYGVLMPLRSSEPGPFVRGEFF